MIVWSSKLYCDEKTKKSCERLKKRIETNRLTHDLYCITFAENEENLLEILPAKEFKFPHYRRRELYIIGLARGRDEADTLVRDMIEEMYRETGAFRVREYFR